MVRDSGILIEELISRYYGEKGELRDILTTHSRLVADMALECARRRGIDCDMEFVEQAALLHDIGIVKCDAPDICCHGAEPYIRHGVEGRAMLEAEGLPRHALVCERHTGAGLTVDDIIRERLPLPHRDMTPQTVEERLICYADKFYSKSGDITRRKTLEKVRRSMARHGEETLARFEKLHSEFGN